MLIVTIIVPYIASPYVSAASVYGDIGSPVIPTIIKPFVVMLRGSFLWLFSGSALIVSLIIAIKLKSAVPSFILLASTIVYGFWYAYLWYGAVTGGSCMDGMFLLYIVPGSLFFMIPAWIAAFIIETRLRKKKPEL